MGDDPSPRSEKKRGVTVEWSRRGGGLPAVDGGRSECLACLPFGSCLAEGTAEKQQQLGVFFSGAL